MIQKLKVRNFCIQDNNIKEFMRINQVEHLKFNTVLDDEVYIIVEYPDYDNLLSFDKNWLNVNWGGRAVYVRIPSIFRDHIGQEVEVYQDNIFRKSHEVFRIRPIGFDLVKGLKAKSRRIKINVPYFSKEGQCIIPKKYIRDNNLTRIFTSRLSFNRVDSYLVSQGFIFARVTRERDVGGLSYPLMECSNGVRTRKINGVLDILCEHGKKIRNFQFLKTVYDKTYEYDLIVFKEVKLD